MAVSASVFVAAVHHVVQRTLCASARSRRGSLSSHVRQLVTPAPPAARNGAATRSSTAAQKPSADVPNCHRRRLHRPAAQVSLHRSGNSPCSPGSRRRVPPAPSSHPRAPRSSPAMSPTDVFQPDVEVDPVHPHCTRSRTRTGPESGTPETRLVPARRQPRDVRRTQRSAASSPSGIGRATRNSPVDSPRRYRIGSTSATFARPSHLRRQDPACEPLPLTPRRQPAGR